MKSRMLSMLEARITNTSDPQEVACLRAEMATYFARLGDSFKATNIIRELRNDGARNLDGDAVCWINYAEGMIGHYAGDEHVARQKWERSRAVARSIGNNKVVALASSWLAFSDYLSEKLDSLANNSIEAIANSTSDSHSARSRISLTLGLCSHFCERYASARSWYTECRLSAVKEGDEVMLAALIHDMAWMTATNHRNRLFRGQLAVEDACGLLMVSAESARNYESLIGSSSLPGMTPLLIAQTEILNGAWEGAIQKITENFAASRAEGFGRLQAGLLADRAYCLASLGRFGEANSDASVASALDSSELHLDDRAVLHARLAQTFAILNERSLQQIHEARAAISWNELSAFKDRMLEIVTTIENAVKSNQFI